MIDLIVYTFFGYVVVMLILLWRQRARYTEYLRSTGREPDYPKSSSIGFTTFIVFGRWKRSEDEGLRKICSRTRMVYVIYLLGALFLFLLFVAYTLPALMDSVRIAP